MKSTGYIRLAAAIVLSCVTLIAITWAVTLERIDFERERLVAQTEASTANLAVAFEEHTLHGLKSINQTLVLLKHEYLQKGRNINLQAVLEDAEVETQYFTVGILDARGEYVSGTAKGTPANQAKSEFFTAQLHPNSKLFISKPHRRSYSAEQVIVFSHRIEDEAGRFAGVAVLSTTPDYFIRFSKSVELGREGLLTLIGLDGITRVRQVGDRVSAGEDMRGIKILAEQARHRRGQFLSPGTLEGIPRYVAFRTLENYPLILTVGLSQRDILATLEVARERHLWVGARITLFIIVIGLLLVYALSRQRAALSLLTRSESRFRAIFEQAFVGMGEHGLDGRPLRVNDKLCKILGYGPDELVGINPVRVTYPDDVPASGDFCGEFHSGERRMITKDGSTIWVDAAWTLVRDADGKPDCYVSVVQDISEFKRVDQMKSEFVSMVSHELRTPLTSIRGSLGLIAGGVAGSLPEPVRNLVDIAKNNCERLIRLINDILDTEKIESGKMGFELKEVELGRLLEAAIAANEGFAAQHNVTLTLAAPEEPVPVNVDGDRLNQVITNLISNAVKFSPAGKAVEVSLGRHAGWARVEIRDHGGGIPEEFRVRMFQKFSQADSSDSRSRGGTGLGLNISKAIVERLGGNIGFETPEDGGTRFYFQLPTLLRAEDIGGVEPGRPVVLVCEDDPQIASVIAGMLDKAGFAADLAFTAAEARRRALRGMYAAMTVDLRLPDQHGVALIRTLREAPVTAELPIIVVSAICEEGRLQLNDQSNTVSEWLEKPIDENKLMTAVRLAADGHATGFPRILHVEDDPDIQRIAAAIAQDFATFEFAGTLREARARMAQWNFDLVLLDLQLPDGSGWDLVTDIESHWPRPPVVVFSVDDGRPEEANRVAAMLVKGSTSNELLLETIRPLIQRGRKT
jgi:PAS domain S-box-containing protein